MAMSIIEISKESHLPLEEAKEQFLYNVMKTASHDLKTSLACIIGALEIFERTKNKLPIEKQQALIKTALQEAHKLNEIVTKILEIR